MTEVNNRLQVLNDLGLTRKNEVKPEETKQDQFMKLMIAQLQNQDPFEPQENGEFLSQLAQFDTATGIKDLQNSFSDFTSTMQSNSALQASTLVGHNVLVPGGQGYLEVDSDISGTVDLTASTSQLKVEILDGAGQLVKNMNLGEKMSGKHAFSWDGTDDNGNLMPPGKYSIKSYSKIGNENVAQNVLLSAKVDSVSIGQYGQGLKLNLLGMGQVDFNAVTEIR